MTQRLLTTILISATILTSCTPGTLPIISAISYFFNQKLDDFLNSETAEESTVDQNSIQYIQDLEYRYDYPENYLEMLQYEADYSASTQDVDRWASIKYLVALYQSKMQNHSEAKNLLTDIAFMYESNTVYHELYLGYYYLIDGDMQEAKRLFNLIDNIIPDSRYLNEGYARIYLNRKDATLFNPKKAIHFAQKSLDEGNYYYGHITLAEAYLKNKEANKAMEEIEKALSFRKIHPADVLLKLSIEYAKDHSLKLKKKINAVILKNRNAKYIIEDYFNCTYADFLK